MTPSRWRSGPGGTDDLAGLVHHSDRGVQYLAIRYTERLADEGAVTSVGSKGDSYDNALAETVNGLDKTELIRGRVPGGRPMRSSPPPRPGWPGGTPSVSTVPAGDVPPAEFEAAYHSRLPAATEAG